MTAMLVTIAAMSGLSAARSRLREVEATSSTSEARFYAECAVEMGLHAISHDSDWRDTYTNDEWQPVRPIAGGGYSWKIVDEEDDDLDAGQPGPVRLYGKGVIGDAMRVYSVELKPRAPANLLDNAGFESGARGWSCRGGCDIEPGTISSHGGVAYALVTDRVGLDAGVYYDLTSQITNGETYYVEAWISSLVPGRKVELVVDATGGRQTRTFQTNYFDADWRKVSGSATLGWSGTLNEAYLKIYPPLSFVDFRVDDVLLVEGNSPPDTKMVPVPGSWRREAGT